MPPTFLWGLFFVVAAAAAPPGGITYDVTCSAHEMCVTLGPTNATLFVQNLRGFQGCHPELVKGRAQLRLPLDHFHQCGTTRMLNKYTGHILYYNRLVLEEDSKREVILVKCLLPDDKTMTSWERRKRSKRDFNDWPPGFLEAEDLNVTSFVAHAPTPYLNFAIRQNGRYLDTGVNVQPGTPLEMVIYLDSKSATTYGLLTSYLKVTDGTPQHNEVIFMNGCSIDPYIFGNFETPDEGNSLYSKFRAFKFPDTNYVLFVGTVNICLQFCRSVQCGGNEQVGYGRRRKREVPAQLPFDPNKLYEVEMTTALRVQLPHKPESVAESFTPLHQRGVVWREGATNGTPPLLCWFLLLALTAGLL